MLRLLTPFEAVIRAGEKDKATKDQRNDAKRARATLKDLEGALQTKSKKKAA